MNESPHHRKNRKAHNSLFFGLALFIALLGKAQAEERESPGQRLDPAQYATPIAWFEGVDKASTTKGWSRFDKISRGVNAVLTMGVQEVELRALPQRFQHLKKTDVAFKGFVFNTWTAGRYGTSITSGELTGKPDLALGDWCSANGGLVIKQPDQTGWLWTCDRDGQFLAVVHVGLRSLRTPLLTVLQPTEDSQEGVARFTELMTESNLLTAAQAKKATNQYFAGLIGDELERQEKVVTEAPLRRSIGTQVCQDSRHESGMVFTFVGFVEAKSPDADKVKINIVRRLAKKGGLTFDDREDRIVWDNPDAWYVCQ